MSKTSIPTTSVERSRDTFFSYRCEMRDSTFRYSHLYNGGQGYGVGLYDVSTKCLVENNIFQHLHVSMQVNYGSSGNGIAYNYAYDAVSDVGENLASNAWPSFAPQSLRGELLPAKSDVRLHSRSAATTRCSATASSGYQAGKTLNQCTIDFDRYNRYCNAVGNILGRRASTASTNERRPATHART